MRAIAAPKELDPVVGLWYLAVYVRLGVSSAMHDRQQRSLIGSLEGRPDPG